MRLSASGSLEYAHARIGARWGARPDEALWRRIEATRESAGVLELVRGSALARWVEGLGPADDAHRIERTLRRAWRANVRELAGWLPEPWQEALAWCERLIDLPLLQHLARGETMPPWADEGVALHGLAEGKDPAALLPQWLHRWCALLPRGAGRDEVVGRLLPLLQAHATAFADGATVDGRAARHALLARIVQLLRRAALEPVEAFAWLAAQALELERLRGELVQRAALPQRGGGA